MTKKVEVSREFFESELEQAPDYLISANRLGIVFNPEINAVGFMFRDHDGNLGFLSLAGELMKMTCEEVPGLFEEHPEALKCEPIPHRNPPIRH